MKRLAPVTGSMTVAASSPTRRARPVSRVSRINQPARWNISPSAMPPIVVVTKSLIEAWFRSPKYSQVRLPKAASGADSQKLNPLARPALK